MPARLTATRRAAPAEAPAAPLHPLDSQPIVSPEANVAPFVRGGTAWRGSLPSRTAVVVPIRPHAIPGPQLAPAAAKRILDLLLALPLLVFLAPMLLVIAALIPLDSRGPILFRQRRSGLNGRVFGIYKFRTMLVMEDDMLSAATRGDRRVTGLGAVLRRTSLDELPQLLNVLSGDMSLVGPRPHAVAHDVLFSADCPEYPQRFRVRPGITGLAQVCGHRGEVDSPACLRARLDADLDYIDHWSLWLDIKILIATTYRVWNDDKAY